MKGLRNLLAVAGAIALLALAAGGVTFAAFDFEAFATYRGMLGKLIGSGDPAEALVWKVRVKEGLGFDDVDAAIRSRRSR